MTEEVKENCKEKQPETNIADMIKFPGVKDLGYMLNRHPLAQMFQSPRSHGLSLMYMLLILQGMATDLKAIKEILETKNE